MLRDRNPTEPRAEETAGLILQADAAAAPFVGLWSCLTYTDALAAGLGATAACSDSMRLVPTCFPSGVKYML